MATTKPKSKKQYPIPEELPKIIRRFTKEVLRNQPKDIHKFGKIMLIVSFVSYMYNIFYVCLYFNKT